MKILFLLFAFISFKASAGTYAGFNYGYAGYTSDSLEKYHVGPKGNTYGGFFGFGKNALGLEFLYQNLSTKGKIDHDGAKHTINEGATAMGGAVRLSFNYFYLRGGLASYSLDQSVAISNATSRGTAEELYDIRKKGARQSGSLFGAGVHTKWGAVTMFLDFTRYQMGNAGHYDAVGVGFSFPISDRLFSIGKD